MQMFMVGGAVRDELLGIKSKDIDFTIVLPPVESDPFRAMVNRLQRLGHKIFLESPEFLTVRAQFPKGVTGFGGARFANGPKLPTADFVLARKESDYTDGRRPDKVEVGTLTDDLRRRDFTMNAIAKDSNGNLIDPHNGIADINHRLIRAVGDPMDRLREDALRALRAIRFSVTKGFTIESNLLMALHSSEMPGLVSKVSDERIKGELSNMFRHNTVDSLVRLQQFPALTNAIFSGTVSLDATMKTKGRG